MQVEKVFLAVALSAALGAAPYTARAEAPEPKQVVREIAAQTDLLQHVDTLYRLTEELVFWQANAIMGAHYQWEFSYNQQGNDIWPWTLRLYNALDESEVEAKRAAAAIERSKTASDADKAAGAALYALHLEMRAVATDVHALLLDQKVDAAAAVYESRGLALRRDIANKAYSVSSDLRSRIKRAALKVR